MLATVAQVFRGKVLPVDFQTVLAAIAGVVLLALLFSVPLILLLAAYGRWSGRKRAGPIDLQTSKFYPHCRSRRCVPAMIAVTASVVAFPLFVLVPRSRNAEAVFCLIGAISALVGMVTALLAKPGIRGIVLISSVFCLLLWFLIVGGLAFPD